MRGTTPIGVAQEDDRTGGYDAALNTIIRYSRMQRGDKPLRVLLLNDGPGLVAGSMWEDYAALENRWNGNIVVATLKMLDDRVTSNWIKGR